MIKKKVMKCYRNKIEYWQKKLEMAINPITYEHSEENITRALSRLTYFVNKQKEIDFPPVQAEVYFCNLNQHIEDMNGIDEAIAGELF